MNKMLRALVITIVLIASCLFLVCIYDLINDELTDYVRAKDNTVTVNNLEDGKLYKISHIKKQKDTIELNFVKNTDKPILLTINFLGYAHKIYINNKLVSQNIDKNGDFYDARYAYKSFILNENSNVIIIGDKVAGTSHFIANMNTMQEHIQLRTFFYSMYLIIFFIIGIINMFMFYKNRSSYYFGVMGFISIILLIKIFIRGNLFFLCSMLSMDYRSYINLNSITGILCMCSPAIATAMYFEVPIKKWFMSLVSIILLLAMIISKVGDYSSDNNLIICLATPVIIYSLIYGITHNNKRWLWLVIANECTASASLYKSFISSQIFRNGEINFLTYIPGTGLAIFMIMFLFIFIDKHFKYVDNLKDKEEKYKKIELLRGIGHDLKIPITVIKSSTQIIKKYELGKEEREKYLETELEAIYELELMVQNINSYLNEAVRNKSCDEYIYIKESFEYLDSQLNVFRKKNTHNIIIYYSDKDAVINMSYSDFYRIMFNLVSNAYKYTKKGGRIEISYSINDDVSIIIKDTGIGMSKTEVKKIFEPFYRADKARSEDGLGIGLCVVKHIIENTGGSIFIDSTVGEGTVVKISLKKDDLSNINH